MNPASMTTPMGGLGGAPGAAGPNMQGMSEQEQAMVKMVHTYPSPFKLFLSHPKNQANTPIKTIDVLRHGILPHEDRHGRNNGFRSGWCLRFVYG